MTDKQVRAIEAMTLFWPGMRRRRWSYRGPGICWPSIPKPSSVCAELDEVLAGRTPTVDDWPRLRFTEMIALESMRLYPPAYTIGREAIVDYAIGGYAVPKGATVLLPQWVVHAMPVFTTSRRDFGPSAG